MAHLSPADRQGIVEVLTRYATAIDRRDWTLLRRCFSSNFEADYQGFGRWHGPEEITEFMRQAHADIAVTLHRLSNFEISADGDGAAARTYCDLIMIGGDPPAVTTQAVGCYDDALIKAPTGWLIHRRKMTVFYTS